jgi:hypothetical protein
MKYIDELSDFIERKIDLILDLPHTHPRLFYFILGILLVLVIKYN